MTPDDDWPALIDTALAALDDQQRRARTSITLIPSENSLSPLARLPLLTDATNRYFFNDTGTAGWAFPAGREASAVETSLTLPLLRRLTGAAHVTVRPLSGLHAMTLALSALGGPPATPVVTVHPGQGGHYATADLARRLGLRPHLAGGPDPHSLDLDLLADLVATHTPPLVYIDQSHALFPFDIPAIAGAVTAAHPHTRVHVDVSHCFGLIAGGALPNPLDHGAHSIGGSTHKTFPGPQKGFLATNDPQIATLISAAQPTFISNHHLAATCSLGLAAAEFLACDGTGYAHTVLAAAKALGHALHASGLTPQATDRGITASHQLWIRTTPSGIDAPTAAERLYQAGIAVNVLPDLPGIDEPALRLGVAEAVYQGLTIDDMAQLADLIVCAILDPTAATAVASQISDLRATRRSPYQLPPDEGITDALGRLLTPLHDAPGPRPSPQNLATAS